MVKSAPCGEEIDQNEGVTYSDARQNLAFILERAAREGEVWIRRRDGKVFVIRVLLEDESPLDVDGVELGISTDEIVEFIKEGRKPYE